MTWTLPSESVANVNQRIDRSHVHSNDNSRASNCRFTMTFLRSSKLLCRGEANDWFRWMSADDTRSSFEWNLIETFLVPTQSHLNESAAASNIQHSPRLCVLNVASCRHTRICYCDNENKNCAPRYANNANENCWILNRKWNFQPRRRQTTIRTEKRNFIAIVVEALATTWKCNFRKHQCGISTPSRSHEKRRELRFSQSTSQTRTK